MAASAPDTALGSRLERLTGEEAACCVPRYKELAEKVGRTSAFRRSRAVAQALADDSRLLAVALLQRRSELCACEIQAALGLTHATVSHHMSRLTRAGITTAERRGKWVYYRLAGRGGIKVL
jgi:DNA-binding transcriptional ArsR family regulator